VQTRLPNPALTAFMDTVLIHTGWGTLWNVDNARYVKACPGIGIAAAEWPAKQDPLLIGADNWPVEVGRTRIPI
jgi:kynurenine formamidase